ncbi:hypothetical protein AVEN_23952-1 [Araneus ventricosus]|uniref:Uncharacterized protein n=1 Tax=Araneus ventricosus TaxID=182803 RepID=A0A4Y2WUD2_ARAVE|nr:hypothetical protein AVEN_23952-1 [Araneus ventricosus]
MARTIRIIPLPYHLACEDVSSTDNVFNRINHIHPAPRNHIIAVCYKKESIIRCQKNGINGEQQGQESALTLQKVKTTLLHARPEIMFVTGHGPFQHISKRFNTRSSDSCVCGKLGNPLHYANKLLCLQRSYHQQTVSKAPRTLCEKSSEQAMSHSRVENKTIHFYRKTITLISKRWRHNKSSQPN